LERSGVVGEGRMGCGKNFFSSTLYNGNTLSTVPSLKDEMLDFMIRIYVIVLWGCRLNYIFF
jgi:hypothetical protein